MLTRRLFLASASALALVGPAAVRGQVGAPRVRAQPVPLPSVRLRPSPKIHENVSGSLSGSEDADALNAIGSPTFALYGPPAIATGARFAAVRSCGDRLAN